MGKNIDLSAYRKPPTKEKLKRDLIIILLIGLIWFLGLMLPWMVWLKPYKEFGHYECEAVYGQNIFVVGTHEEKILYTIEDVQYEKIVKYSRTYYVQNTTQIDFYYEKDNPNYTINERTTWLIAFPCVASLGLILCGWAIWLYKREIKKINNKNNSD